MFSESWSNVVSVTFRKVLHFRETKGELPPTHPPGRLRAQVLQALPRPAVQNAPGEEGEPASDVAGGGFFEKVSTGNVLFQPHPGSGKAVGTESL